jgi:3-hydroxy-9,10-secoandrosta-1,3,5(10)-triene-9,17-dione monooxygenase reductase component
MSAIDKITFRSALGAFPTGVTVITTAHNGVDAGLTANSFNSVSLEPPMVLWSLGKQSSNMQTFLESGHFAIHVLAEHQEDLSTRFAKSGSDKFAGLEFSRGEAEVPLFEGCCARFQCRKVFEYAGGDHIIFVGEVLRLDQTHHAPLAFHRGQYAALAPRGG